MLQIVLFFHREHIGYFGFFFFKLCIQRLKVTTNRDHYVMLRKERGVLVILGTNSSMFVQPSQNWCQMARERYPLDNHQTGVDI